MGTAAGVGMAMAAGAIGAAMGSVMSQGLGMAMGMQDSFSWSQVGMAAVGGGISAGLGQSGMFSNNAFGAMGQAATGNAITQGVAIATGMQEKFSWTQVAASAAGAGVGHKVANGIGSLLEDADWGNTATNFAQGFGSSLASGGAYALASGQRPNWGQIAVDSFGNALGNAAVDGIVQADRERTTSKVLDELKVNKSDDRITTGFVEQMVADGASADQILKLLKDHPTLGSNLSELDSVSRGYSDDELGEVAKNYLESSAAKGDSTVVAPTDENVLPDVVVEAKALKSGKDVLGKTLSSGIELADSLIDIGEKYGVAGKIAYKAVAGLLSGGPIKSVVASLTKYAAGQAADQAIGVAGDAASGVVGGFVAKWATDNNITMRVTLGGVDLPLGPEAFGYAAGQVAGTVTEATLGKGLDSATSRARNVREMVDYSRPSGFRKGVRDSTWDKAIEPSTGRVRDPKTGKFMSKDAPWDMGHKPGYEARKHKASAEEREISRKQYLDEHNNSDHYRPELPSSNRSHELEDKTDKYFGP